MLKKKIELLAPAGSMESLIAAIEGGCDAVYLGLSSYSARAFAPNFSLDNIAEVIAYCHIRSVRVYVTMNTLIYESELKGVQKAVDVLYHADVDGILVQDLGLYHYIHEVYPDLDLHCSTQMHVHNVAGVRFMKEQGASRIVVARESSLETIQKMCQEDIEIEVFVYGAICIAYSGQCLMSSVMKNRSANRGACAQNCRLKYKEDGSFSKEGEYALSPKDLNALELVPDLIEMGVASLKIEGRMKKAEYVYTVTKAFREAIDAHYNHQSYHLSRTKEKELLELFNRGFSRGHLAHSSTFERMSHVRANHQGIPLGKVKAIHGHFIEIILQEDLNQGDGIRILSYPEDIGFVVNKMENKKHLLTNKAKKGEVVQVYCPEGWPKINDEVRLTSNSYLLKEVSSLIEKHERRVSLSIHLVAKVNQFLCMQVKDGTHKFQLVAKMKCQKALKQPLSQERLKEAFGQLTNSAYRLDNFSCELEKIFLPMKEINELRRRMIQKLDEIRSTFHKRIGKQNYQFKLDNPHYQGERLLVRGAVSSVKARYLQKKDYTAVVDEYLLEPSDHENQVLNELGDFYGQNKHCLAGMPLNISNSYAMAYFLSLKGVDALILSSELNPLQIRDMIQNFENRYGFTAFTYQFVFGKRDLMIIKHGFEEKNIKQLSDLQDNIYDLSYTNEQVIIHEPKNFHASNQYAQGSYLIMNEKLDNANKILEDAYEELYERI
ncbi:U32 family peptidase [Bulleidia sp. zg-1006]|uniref:peptidase U32 family protein n=1 Tax=Bulleidia sp. zg-1006 TaxID=2806552 RepID=UPI0019394C02|nr:U32 family peptidase [Bulleidia sp. zg-1006]QRG87356.1 U32 family peptidase [Bulleidia sp. zg-1006]